MSTISTHILDLGAGAPARGVTVKLEIDGGARGWVSLGERRTDDDGRVRDFLGPGAALDRGRYRLTFEVGEYFRARGATNFHPRIPVEIEVADAAQHYHVPLLLSAHGYTTYRGT